ncbi:hypothetical protein GCM10022254_41170 [Actinomadura meridiana]|uniref:Uncharacterized protein n=1 Tax=Actinomadura meridiana TaxID=559626 RepID=A0ABP8C7A9_9ACTN
MGTNIERLAIRDGMSFGTYDVSGMSHEDVKNKLKSLKPEKVGHASTAYKDAADVLAEMSSELRNNFAKRIIKHWQGDVAQQALDQLGQVHDTSVKLSDGSHKNATLYAWYKHNVLDWYKTTGETMTDGYIHTGGDDDNARELMKRFNLRMKEAFEGHPLSIEKDLPDMQGAGRKRPGGGPGGGAGGGSGGGPGGGKIDTGSGFPGSDGAGSFPGGAGGSTGPLDPGRANSWAPGAPGDGVPGGGSSGDGSLSGTPGSDLSNFPGGGGGALPGGGAAGGGFGADPGGLGGNSAGPGAGAGFGSSGVAGPGGGVSAAGRGVGMHGGPVSGMPMGMGGGNQGGEGEERERETWLSEDEAPWGGDEDTAPPVIG